MGLLDAPAGEFTSVGARETAHLARDARAPRARRASMAHGEGKARG